MLPTLSEVPLYLRTTIDASLCTAYIAAHHMGAAATYADPDPPPEGKPRIHRANPDATRVYASQYVGVTRHGERWVAQWGVRCRSKGALRELTDAGERAAACDRALALGLDYLERRDGTREGL